MPQLPTYHLKSYPSSIVAAGLKCVEHHSIAHWHDCCELELVLSGVGTHYINDTPHELKAGDIYMLTTFDYHEIIAEERICVLGIMFEDDLISDELFGRLMSLGSTGEALSTQLPKAAFERVKSCFEAVIAEEERLISPDVTDRADDLARMYIGRMIDCILIETLRILEADPKLTDNRPIREAIIYICRHFREPITLPELAARFYLSESYLSRLFSSVIGQSYKSFLVDLRLRCACRLLATTALSVTDICYDCGFGSYSHFMRSFREHYRMTPMSFRELHRKK